MNFQDAIKEISEQINIHLKDKRISSLLTDVIGASFAANVIQLASLVSGDGSEVNSYWSCTRPFSPANTRKKVVWPRETTSNCVRNWLEETVNRAILIYVARAKLFKFG